MCAASSGRDESVGVDDRFFEAFSSAQSVSNISTTASRSACLPAYSQMKTEARSPS